ncbi:phage distal tail protein [Xiamenia xianingshaonis]|uniref:Phage tail family protein n=1 Tax=Xiamenia xianingshaonis TaxID=2682776 RepID=A0A9E6MRW6_9ACTN|nr:phage tail domain-containing protein [Xiamenia xianingshaonis]NHM14440.1 hypothetical protein [Xiamenia xianingshaonis]QTU84913.1 phage tail family protein [Xiamenia xianingshaonis]
MRSFVFNGFDFGALTRAKVVSESALCVKAETARVPRRAGEAVLDVAVPPKVVRMKLFLEPMMKTDANGLDAMRRKLHAALLATEPCEFRYQDNHTYRDALCTDAGAWDTLFEAGVCELGFTMYDPIAYSRVMRTERGTTFEVGGTWKSWPCVEVTADGTGEITVANADAVSAVALEGAFSEGDVVVIDYEHETVRVNGEAASERIALASTFSALRPGVQRFAFSGCTDHKVSFYERWV